MHGNIHDLNAHFLNCQLDLPEQLKIFTKFDAKSIDNKINSDPLLNEKSEENKTSIKFDFG